MLKKYHLYIVSLARNESVISRIIGRRIQVFLWALLWIPAIGLGWLIDTTIHPTGLVRDVLIVLLTSLPALGALWVLLVFLIYRPIRRQRMRKSKARGAWGG